VLKLQVLLYFKKENLTIVDRNLGAPAKVFRGNKVGFCRPAFRCSPLPIAIGIVPPHCGLPLQSVARRTCTKKFVIIGEVFGREKRAQSLEILSSRVTCSVDNSTENTANLRKIRVIQTLI
jgi:hypothetical protein